MEEKVKSIISHIIIVLLSTFLLAQCAILPTRSYVAGEAEIYEWVKARMKITKDYPRPEVKRVSQKELGKIVSKKISAKTYDRWVEEIGEKRAAEYKQNMMDGIRGLFVVEDATLYIANDVGTLVRQKGIIAHEYIHYLQQKSLGIVDTNSDWGVMEYFRREMMATMIEEEYIKHICPKCDEKGIIRKEEKGK